MFDWPGWQTEAQRYFADPDLLASADVATLQKLVTTLVRAERFSGGYLAQAIDSGRIRAILRRLQAIRDAG